MGTEMTWNDLWVSSWKGKSGVRSVEEQHAWQSGDDTTLFEMEVWTPPCEEAQNKGETVQSEKVECVKTETSVFDDQKAWKCWTTMDSERKSRINKLVMGDSDKIPRLRARSKKVKTSNRFEVLGRGLV